MKTKTQNFTKIPSNVDDHGRRIKDNDLRIGTWNVLILLSWNLCYTYSKFEILIIFILKDMYVATDFDSP